MKRNMGTADRIIRAVLGAVFAVLIFKGTVTGLLAWALGIVAAAFLATAAVGFCPAYLPLRINTCGKGGCRPG